MFKTICVLGCCLGLSGTWGYGQESDSGAPVYYWTWSATEGAQSSATGWSETFIYTEGQDYAQFGGSQHRPYNTGITGIGPAFTISFDVKQLSQSNQKWQDMLALRSGSNNMHNIKLEFNDSGQVYVYAKNFGGQTIDKNIDSQITSSQLQSATDWINFRLVSDPTAQTLTLYVDGTQTGQIENWNPTQNLSGAQFGSEPGGGRAMNGTMQINNIYFYNAAIPPTHAPEPAVAALTLLGLSGLCLRRKK